jgi:hypothetical protein
MEDRNFISSGENIGYGLFACRHDKARAFDQARSEQVMLQICDGFGARADREALRHGAEAEAGDLRKDEPHPMCLLPTVRQFRDDLPVDRRLRGSRARGRSMTMPSERTSAWALPSSNSTRGPG